MNRRSFFKNAALGVAATGFPASEIFAENFDNQAFAKPKTIKPQRLREGDVIGLVAPGSPPSEEKMAKALDNLTMLGFKIKQSPNLRARNGYIAGSDEQRLADLHWAFSDTEIKAVWCVRGGYGCARLLPKLDFDLIRKNPKPLVGYSDITALHIAIHQKTGLITFHGPVGTSDYTEPTVRHLRRMLFNPTSRYEIHLPGENDSLPGEEYRPEILTEGQVVGKTIGGNLSLLASLVGTKFCPVFKDKIVFIEDVGEQPYRIDRMLTQLLQATDLSKAAGIALGVFEDCQPTGKEPSQTLSETLRERLGGLGVPVVYGLPFGHISDQATIPLGVLAELNTAKKALTLVDWAVES